MVVTFLKDKNRYVDTAGRLATVAEYGKDFYKCAHDFQDTGRRGETPGANGKRTMAAAYQCSKCHVFTVIEFNK